MLPLFERFNTQVLKWRVRLISNLWSVFFYSLPNIMIYYACFEQKPTGEQTENEFYWKSEFLKSPISTATDDLFRLFNPLL